MIFKLMPTPIYISLCVFLIIASAYYSISRKGKDSYKLLMIYRTSILIPVFPMLDRIFKDYTNIYLKYKDFIGYCAISIIVIYILELNWLAFTFDGPPEKKKFIIWGLILIWVPAIFLITLIIFVK